MLDALELVLLSDTVLVLVALTLAVVFAVVGVDSEVEAAVKVPAELTTEPVARDADDAEEVEVVEGEAAAGVEAGTEESMLNCAE